MFSDIANFTTIAETVGLDPLMRMLEEYYSVMSDCILKSDGTVGEFIGDGIMSFWNSPEDVKNHSQKAIESALLMQQSLDGLNEKWRRDILPNFPEVRSRIGIHTGEVLSGNVGSPQRMKFGLVGDAVNLASRLEGACKHYGVSLLVSQDTKEMAGPYFTYRSLDNVAVKGKKQGIWVHQVLGIKAVLSKDKKNYAKEYSIITKSLFQNKDLLATTQHLKSFFAKISR